jgi:hypothetical protein
LLPLLPPPQSGLATVFLSLPPATLATLATFATAAQRPCHSCHFCHCSEAALLSLPYHCCEAALPLIHDEVLRKISDALLTDLFYNIGVKKKPLSQTNPYLLDRDERRAALIRTTVSSSAIEGIRYSSAEIDASFLDTQTPEKLRKGSKSGESRR